MAPHETKPGQSGKNKQTTWRAPIAALWNLRSVLKSWAISRTRRWKGNFLMSSSVDFWYLLISRRATVPGLYLWGFFTPPVEGALFRAALVASCLRGALPPVDLRAVCLVRAISYYNRDQVVYNCNHRVWGVGPQVTDFSRVGTIGRINQFNHSMHISSRILDSLLLLVELNEMNRWKRYHYQDPATFVKA